jgi:hypothetical protein
MAKRNDMSAARRSRNRKKESSPLRGDTAVGKSIGKPVSGWVQQSNHADVARVINAERDRLMKAQAVLRCVVFALLYEDWLDEPHRPSYVDAVAVIRDLVDEAIARLGGG